MVKTIAERYKFSCESASDIHEHIPTIYKYATQCKRIVELGVWQGNSSTAMLHSRPDMMFSCDIKMTQEARELEAQAKTEGINYTLIEANDLQIDIPECDMLFIDTEHSDPQVYAELCRHAHRASKYILFHDTVSYGFMENGLVLGICRFLEQHKEWKIKEHFINNNGLTVLERR